MKKAAILLLTILVTVSMFAGCKEEVELSNISELSAVPSQDGIYVQWEASPDANCYYVYRVRQDEERYAYWGVTDKTEFTDVTVLEGYQYSYRVYPAIQTVDGYERGDQYLKTGSVLRLPNPMISSLQVSQQGCIIRWEPIDQAVQYSVYRGLLGETELEHVADTEVNFYIDPVYDGSIAYRYVVESRCLVDGNMYSSQQSAAAVACRVPEFTSVVREDLYTSVLTWESVAEGVEYSIYRATAQDGKYELLGVTSETMYRDTQADYLIAAAPKTEQTETLRAQGDTAEETQTGEEQAAQTQAPKSMEPSSNDTATQKEVTAEYYYKIKATSADQEVLLSSNMSPSVKLDATAPTTSLFVAKYVDFANEKEFLEAQSSTIYASEFEQDLKYLQQEGYTTITSKELMNYINDAIPLPEKSVMLTIDSARYGVYEYAYPLLQKYNMKAVLSVVGKYADSERGATPELRTYCNWDEIAEMSVSGCVELASGGYYLVDASDTSVDGRDGVLKIPYETMQQYIQVIGNDVDLINGKIRDITGASPSVFVYPYALNDSVSDDVLINEYGYQLLLSDNDARRTRMNHFIDNAPSSTQLPLINRRDRLTGTMLSEYILGAQRFDRMILPDMEETMP